MKNKTVSYTLKTSKTHSTQQPTLKQFTLLRRDYSKLTCKINRMLNPKKEYISLYPTADFKAVYPNKRRL